MTICSSSEEFDCPTPYDRNHPAQSLPEKFAIFPSGDRNRAVQLFGVELGTRSEFSYDFGCN